MTYLLGIDAGSTIIKAVLFDVAGHEVTSASCRVRIATPRPAWVERDTLEVVEAGLKAVRTVVDNLPGTDAGGSISALAITGHGDGVYLTDAAGKPTRPGILSLDTRAAELVEEWERAGVHDAALELTGQPPFPAAASALLAWLREHEPEVLARSSFALSCKDLLKLAFTGEATTDLTDASCSFVNVATQRYDERAFELYGLGSLRSLLPPIVGSTRVAGRVTAEVAEYTGLRRGTPVVSGLHDVDACAIGSGSAKPGAMTLIAGTYNINEVVADQPHTSPMWLCRSFVEPGQWMSMAVSPTSASNLEWFADNLSSVRLEDNTDPFAALNVEVAKDLHKPDDLLYLPFLYGSPFGKESSGGFLGLRAWHSRGQLVRAVMEGVVHTHRWHVEQLRRTYQPELVTLTGGGGRSGIWSQMFADALGQPVSVPESNETGALGAALCAGVGVGMFADLAEGVDRCVRYQRRHEPSEAGAAVMQRGYQAYLTAVDALGPVWRGLAAIGSKT
ncbi:FGGY-family carbohydrate kinase [Acrocarpospora catenulata]|uniref:FGGY-family carbohydrate kinase n=1 Tax=Acrocarpospora catenulata TaxID=2836182 RepID=UPI001BDAC669|nr:FGGY-family carbohydrate kinase [Acrocarpospora catenulata]